MTARRLLLSLCLALGVWAVPSSAVAAPCYLYGSQVTFYQANAGGGTVLGTLCAFTNDIYVADGNFGDSSGALRTTDNDEASSIRTWRYAGHDCWTMGLYTGTNFTGSGWLYNMPSSNSGLAFTLPTWLSNQVSSARMVRC